MTQRSKVPFNVSILQLTPHNLQGLKPVRSLSIFQGASANFDEDGLFSVSIFGKVGDERRSVRYSYIDVKVPIFHPIILRALMTLKRLYAGIIAGTEYAVWNADINDFEKSTVLEGQTGFAFFVEHWEKIEFTETGSTTREQKILMLMKYKKVALTTKVLVMPAGLRDVEIDSSGRVQEDEINGLYRRLIAIANTISDQAAKNPNQMINTSRFSMQTVFSEIYETIESMIEGKKKLLMGRWATRRIMNGTRNVITAMDTSSEYLGAPGAVGFNDTIIGLYQAMKGAMPKARFELRHGFLSRVFPAVGVPAALTNKKTLKSEQVVVKPQVFDRWMTDEGLEGVITAFQDPELRHKPIEIEGRYLGLIYKGPDNTYRLMQDIDELPETRSKQDVHPLTFAELMYLSTFKMLNKLSIFVTRYPVTGLGSIYPSKVLVRTTIESEVRTELDALWKAADASCTAYEFPVVGGEFVDSLVPHSAKLGGLGADFDGDTGSGNIVYSDEANKEIDDYFKLRRAYIGTDGRFMASTGVSTVDLVLHNMTGA